MPAREPGTFVRIIALCVALTVPSLGPAGSASAADCIRYEDHLRRIGFVRTLFLASGVAVDESAGIAYVGGWDEVPVSVGPGTPGTVAGRAAGSVRGGLAVVSFLQPDRPDLLVRIELPVRVDDLALHDDHVFLAGEDGDLVVVDVTNPAAPSLVGLFDTPGAPVEIVVAGGIAYVAAGAGGGLLIYDVAVPSAPVLLAQVAGGVTGIDVEGSLAYASLAGGDQLAILDVSDPSLPVEVGRMNAGNWDATGVAAEAGTAYLAWASGVTVVDVSDPTQPVARGHRTLPSEAVAVAVAGGALFAGSAFDGVCAVDVSDPDNPVLRGTVHAGSPVDLALAGDHVLVAGGDAGLQVLDASSLDSVAELAVYRPLPYRVHDVAAVGDLALVVEGPQIEMVDFSAETVGVPIGSAPSVNARAVRLVGTTAYLVGTGAMQVFDVSDPANPQSNASIALPGSNRSVQVAGSHAFVGAIGLGLHVLDVSDPTQPFLVTTLDAPLLDGADLDGGFVFLAAGAAGGASELLVVDVGDPLAPVVAGRARIGGGNGAGVPWALDVDGGYAYVACRWEGLKIFDVRDPYAPEHFRTIQPAWVVSDVQVKDGLAHLATSDGLQIFDVRDVEDPVSLGGAPLPIDGLGGHSQERIYALLSGTSGLRTFPPQCTPGAPALAFRGRAKGLPAEPGGPALVLDGRNPSSGPLELKLAVRFPERVAVTVHDAAGRRVRTIAERAFPAGATALRWDGLDDAGARAAAGVYFVRAKAASGTFTRKVVRIPE